MVDKNRLMGHIISKGYSQRTLSEKIGVSKNTLNSKINGHSSFDVDLIEKICDTLSITELIIITSLSTVIKTQITGKYNQRK